MYSLQHDFRLFKHIIHILQAPEHLSLPHPRPPFRDTHLHTYYTIIELFDKSSAIYYLEIITKYLPSDASAHKQYILLHSRDMGMGICGCNVGGSLHTLVHTCSIYVQTRRSGYKQLVCLYTLTRTDSTHLLKYECAKMCLHRSKEEGP